MSKKHEPIFLILFIILLIIITTIYKEPPQPDKIKSEVDSAITVYQNETKPEASGIIPIYQESPPDNSRAQQLLGGEMRLCAPWAPDCPIDSIVK